MERNSLIKSKLDTLNIRDKKIINLKLSDLITVLLMCTNIYSLYNQYQLLNEITFIKSIHEKEIIKLNSEIDDLNSVIKKW
jgi:hypothetical protein